MVSEWLIGVALCLGGAALTNLGLNLQKLSFARTDAAPVAERSHTLLQPLWLFGLSIFLVGQLGGMLAMGFSSQSVVATLGSFSLVTNAIFAPLILKEKLTKELLLSIVIIIGGSVLVIASSNHDNQDYSLVELLALFRRTAFIIYIVTLTLLLIVCVAVIVRQHRRYRQREEADGELVDETVGFINGDSLSGVTCVHNNTESVVDQIVPVSPESPQSQLSKPLLVTQSPTASPVTAPPPAAMSALTPTLTAAILSSISVLLGKCTMQLIKTSMQSNNQFFHPVSWLICGVFVTAAVSSVHLLNVGLRRGTALFVVPFYYVSSTSLAIIGGLVYFEEFATFTLARSAIFFAGVAVTVFGVYVSTRGQMEVEEREREEEEEEEELTEDETVDALESRAELSLGSPVASLSAASYVPPSLSVLVPSSEDDSAESAKIRAWHSKRVSSEPNIAAVQSSPQTSEPMSQPLYGTFVPSSQPSHPRATRAHSMSMLSINVPGSVSTGGRARFSAMTPSRHGHRSRRAPYTPHYTFAFFSLLPSTPGHARLRERRSVSMAATPRALRSPIARSPNSGLTAVGCRWSSTEA